MLKKKYIYVYIFTNPTAIAHMISRPEMTPEYGPHATIKQLTIVLIVMPCCEHGNVASDNYTWQFYDQIQVTSQIRDRDYRKQAMKNVGKPMDGTK